MIYELPTIFLQLLLTFGIAYQIMSLMLTLSSCSRHAIETGPGRTKMWNTISRPT